MRILETRVMRGPNYWSSYRKNIIVLKVDIGELEEKPTNKIPGFDQRLIRLLPGLYEHECSEHRPGGFLSRVRAGTWIGHVMEHVAIELQVLAGMECGYGRTRSTQVKGVYHVLFEYAYEAAGLFAGSAAFRIVNALVQGQPYDVVPDIEALKAIRDKNAPGPSTAALTREAENRKIPVEILSRESLVLLGHGKNQQRIRASIASSTSCLAVDIAGNKDETKSLLSRHEIPVAKGKVVFHADELRNAIEDIGFPIVIKPVDGNHGNGVSINITSHEEALQAFQLARTISRRVIVEKFVPGYDYRFLVINYKLVAVARRTPAMVIGDGYSTVAQLVEKTNSEPERGDGHANVLTKIVVDESTETLLARRNLTLNHVLPLGEILFLKDTANLSTGGTSRDVTDLVHPYNAAMAERIARIIGLDICGIDVMAQDINIPITEEIGAVLEVNACPGLRMHLAPSRGIGRNVAAPIIDMLFPNGKNPRIPIVAITGTNGKTTTTRLIAHLAKHAGYHVGYTTTDGIYVGAQLVRRGDCTGYTSARTVLNDPTVEFAVLECARGGILRSGLGFDQCDISIVTNVASDHVGLGDIFSIEEMAKVKSVIPQSTAKNGYAILNADDDLVYDMRHDTESKYALFSLSPDNERVHRHCRNGGYAAIVEKGYIVVFKGEWKTRIEKIENIPLCFGGRATLMVKNVLPAVLAAFIRNFSIESIREALHTFVPSPETTPGRMNLFHFRNFDFLLDYAHNADGLAELKSFVQQTPASLKIGIVTGVGDRRAEDIRNVGYQAGTIFDRIIIRLDKDMRGRDTAEMTHLLLEGIRQANAAIPVEVIPDELKAAAHAMSKAPPDALIVLFTEDVWKSIAFVQAELRKEQMNPQQVTSNGLRVA